MATPKVAPASSIGPKDMYLILYNSACCAGWAVVLASSILSLIQDTESSVSDRLANVYRNAPLVAEMLTWVQLAALMEILHAAIGFVRSPVLVTAMQVSSRIFALVAIVYAPSAQGMFCYVMFLLLETTSRRKTDTSHDDLI
jgi:Protein tyrosine phosphatase-like protein, PTPLA